jgi:HipA-like C-terminal domain
MISALPYAIGFAATATRGCLWGVSSLPLSIAWSDCRCAPRWLGHAVDGSLFFRRRGLEAATLSPLDRLALFGERALGALTFEPADAVELTDPDTTLLKLAEEIDTVLIGKDSEVLKDLLVLGGPPHGARPKVLVGYNVADGAISTRPDPKHIPYLVKFPVKNEHKEVCAIEHAYCETARACGIEVPETRHFELGRDHAAFGPRWPLQIPPPVATPKSST